MSRSKIIIQLLLLFVPALLFAQGRQRISFNKDWKFIQGDHPEATAPGYKDANWRSLTLPHDWSIEGKFDKANPAKPEGGALPAGVAWYRKSFTVPAAQKGKKVYLTFDGIYQHSEIWLNGKYLGKRPMGYITFSHEISSVLNWGATNVIAVKVDNSDQPNSRWYSGSGIYRNTWIEYKNPVHVKQWGTYVTTPRVSKKSAQVDVETNVLNGTAAGNTVRLKTTILNAAGKTVSTASRELSLNKGENKLSQTFNLNSPQLWSTEQPYLYTVETEIYKGSDLIDSYTTPLGVRYFNFDQKTGFSLNGVPTKILGVCMHHDLGALGAAVNKRAIERQLELLKEMGCNGIRTAHNPPAPELLELCDKMGFIVMDETFDMWAKKKNSRDYHLDFPEWHKKDLEDHILRDRNHPSIFMWSIGNEIREQFDSTGIALTRELSAIVRSLDKTRPVTSALTEMNPAKNYIAQSNALDIYGFNYNDARYDSLPLKFAGKKFIASETTSAIATRGYYEMPQDTIQLWPANSKIKFVPNNAANTVTAFDNVAAYWGTTHERNWKTVKRLPFMAGLYVWTGFDYLGEPAPYTWPSRSAYFGIFDLAGFPKDSYYMYKSEWTSKPVLHLLPHWNWKTGQDIDVWAYYSQADEVELFLNGKSQGTRRKEGEDLHVAWKLRYEPGTLKAVSRRKGSVVKEEVIRTAGAPASIRLTADRSVLKADGTDLSFVTVDVLDKDGNLVPDADNLVNFSISGPGFIAGVDNGYQASMEPFKASYRKAFNGKCLAIIQTREKAGSIKLLASAEGLRSAEVILTTK